MAIQQNYPSTDNTLIFDFVNRPRLDPRLTFTRSTTATYVSSNGLIQTAAINAPRFDYDPNTYAPKGLFVEYNNTNLLLRSSNVAGSGWVNYGVTLTPTVTSNANIAPDGSNTASLWSRNDANAAYFSQNVSKAASNVTYTLSCYAKQSVGNYLAIRTQGYYPSRADVTFDIANGLISRAATASSGGANGTFSNASASIVPAGNNWYRVALTFTSDTLTGVASYFSFNSGNTTLDSGDSASNSAGYIWGAQLEGAVSNSNPTSYIPTAGSQVTRQPDYLNLTGLPINTSYNQAQGSVQFEMDFISAVTGNKFIFSFNDGVGGGGSQRIYAYGTSGLNFGMSNTSSSTELFSYSGTAPAITPFAKYAGAGAFSTNNEQYAANGTLYNGSTTPAIISNNITQLYLGYSGTGVFNMEGHLKRFIYYPISVTNKNLISLSGL